MHGKRNKIVKITISALVASSRPTISSKSIRSRFRTFIDPFDPTFSAPKSSEIHIIQHMQKQCTERFS